MSKDEFEKMTLQEQTDHWFAELAEMLRLAQQDIFYRADNEETIVVPGITMIVAERTDVYP